MAKKLKWQSFMQRVLAIMFSQVLIKILGLIYKLYLTNREGFGDEGNAIYSSGFQIYALLLTLSSIGVPGAISKLVSERLAVGDGKGAHRIFKIAFVAFSMIGLCGTLILFFGAGYIANTIIGIPEAEYTLIALSPSIFFVATASVIRGYFNGRENISISANSQSLEQLFKTAFTIIIVELIAITSGTSTVFMAAGANLATTIASFLSFMYIYIYYTTRKKEVWQEVNSSVNYRPKRIKAIIKQILCVSIPMSLSSLMSAINKNIDSLTVVRGLKNFLTETEAKVQYGILGGKVDTLTSLPLSFNIALATALVPSIASAKMKGEKDVVTKRISFSILITILIGLPCTIGMFLFSEQILALLFPNARSGTILLQISSFTIIFTVLSQTVNGALQGLGKVLVPPIALGIGACIKLILNLVLIPIPEIGASGAAIGSVVCHTISFIIAYTVLKKNLKLNLKLSKYIIKPLLATTMMGICALFVFFKMNPIIYNIVENYTMSENYLLAERITTIIALLVAIIIYVLSIISLKIFNEDDIQMIPYGKKIYKFLQK